MEQNKNVKPRSFAIGMILLLIAAVLLLLRSDVMKNWWEIKKSPEKYFSYVGKNCLENVNGILCGQYVAKQENFQENGQLYHVREVSIFAEAKALLKTFLDVSLKETTLQGNFLWKEQADETSFTGAIRYGEEEYPIEQKECAENFSVNRLLADDVLSTKRLKKLLESYERLLFEILETQLSSETAKSSISLTKEAVLHEAGGYTVEERKLILELTEEDLLVLAEKVCDRMIQDTTLQEIYTAASLKEETFPEFVEELRHRLKDYAQPCRLEFYVDNRGNVSGMKYESKERAFSFSADLIKDESHIGLAVEILQNGACVFSLEGAMGLKEKALEGTLQGELLLEEEVQEFTIRITGFHVIHLMRGRAMGEVLISFIDGPVKDAGVSVLLNASDDCQEILASLIYGGADQLLAEIKIRDTE